jgi:hypothetical protein
MRMNRWLTCGVLMLTGLAHVSRAQIASAVVPEETRNLNAFLLSVYPELQGKSLDVQIQQSSGGFRFVVKDVSGLSSPLDVRNAPSAIHGTVQFDPSHRLRSFSATGPLLREADNEALATAVTLAGQRGTSTDPDAIRPDIPFGPTRRAEFLAHLNLQGLEKQLNPLVVERVMSRQANLPHHGFLWEVRAAEAGRGLSRLTLMFEPFEGRLVSLDVGR